MSIATLLSALHRCIAEATEYESADDDIETHSAMLRRYRQAEKIEKYIMIKFERYRRKAFMFDNGLCEEDLIQEDLCRQ